MIEYQLDDLTNDWEPHEGEEQMEVVEPVYQAMEKPNVDRVIISIGVSPTVCCLRAL